MYQIAAEKGTDGIHVLCQSVLYTNSNILYIYIAHDDSLIVEHAVCNIPLPLAVVDIVVELFWM